MASSNELITTQRKAGVDLTDWQYRVVIPGITPGVFVKATEDDVFGFILLNKPRKGESARVAMFGRTLARIEEANVLVRGTRLIVSASGSLKSALIDSSTRMGILLENTLENDQIAEIILYPQQLGVVFAMLSKIEFLSLPSAAQNGYFVEDDGITIRATFSTSVNIERPAAGERAFIGFNLGADLKQALLEQADANDLTELIFTYAVEAADLEVNGISIPENSMELRDHIFRVSRKPEQIFEAADLEFDAIPEDLTRRVDAVLPTIVSIEFVTNPTNPAVGYITGAPVQIAVTFSEDVIVGGLNNIGLIIMPGENTTQELHYALSPEMNKLLFQGAVLAGWEGFLGGIIIPADPLVLHSGTSIQDAATNNANLAFAEIPANPAQSVRLRTESLSALSYENSPLPNQGDNYKIGDAIRLRATFTGDVSLDDTAGNLRSYIELAIGVNARQATRVAADDGADYLIYEYVVVEGDIDSDGINVPANSFTVGDDVITGSNGNVLADANLFTHAALVISVSRMVRGVRTTITAINFISNAGVDQTYMDGDVITLNITFDTNVYHEMNDGISIVVQDGGNAQIFNYATIDNLVLIGTQFIRFQATVATATWVSDADGLSIEANALVLAAGSTIKDVAGNDAIITHNAIPAQVLHKVSV